MSVSSEKTALLVSPADTAQRAAPREEDGSGGADLRSGRRGRPLLMPKEAVLEKIRQLARRDEGIFRVHLTHGGLYARARRMFGSWAAAVEAAGVNYQRTIEHARSRALRARRGRPARRRALQDS
jgi:hypothetical protein